MDTGREIHSKEMLVLHCKGSSGKYEYLIGQAQLDGEQLLLLLN
jgi:hypothetical protein